LQGRAHFAAVAQVRTAAPLPGQIKPGKTGRGATMGRPRKITEKVAKAICEHLSDGVPLRAICRMEGMPNWRTVYDWMEADEAFSARIASARARGHEALAEQCIDIADDERDDWVLTRKGVVCDDQAVARGRLRVWTRLQLLAKWDPKRYGEKVTQEHTGPNGGPVQQVQVTMTPAEYEAATQSAFSKLFGKDEPKPS
jgi:hypothetical protein